MIKTSEWKAYNDGVAVLSEGARREVVERLLAWHVNYPDATVAESREYAKSLMNSTVRSFDSLSASFAAEWYDYRAELNGARLRQAITAAVYTPKSVDEVARYQAKKLVKGDFAGFAKACGEYARNDALRSLNETIMANAKRDRKKGVRFARVTTGHENCVFCLMLASRGAVYYSRKTAGEFKHFHRGCDCKVVPGFEDDPDAELVEGVRPKELRDVWKHFEKIDSCDLPKAQKNALKYAYLDTAGGVLRAVSPTPAALVDSFDDAIASAWKDFSKQKTVQNYNSTVGEFLRRIGENYGLSLKGEVYANKRGRVVGARPNGDELWIAVKSEQNGTFLYATAEHKCPDMQTSHGFVEFKTPKSAKKFNALLVDAAKKYDSYQGEEKNAIVSLLHLPNASMTALDAALRFEADSTLNHVAVLGHDGTWIKR